MLRRVRLIAAALAAVALFVAPLPAPAAPAWASVATATIYPGVSTISDGNQCTANFVFFDETSIYLGLAAHCISIDDATSTDGCLARIQPGVREVQIQGATKRGQMVYNSWSTMQQRRETDRTTCRYNDFALVRLDPADHGRVNPSVPVFGGPSSGTAATSTGQNVYGYGNSWLWLGVPAARPHRGVTLSSSAWVHKVYTVAPGIPGDSGSAYLDAGGRALGVLSALELAPFAGSNDVIDLGRALTYMRNNTSFKTVQLATGTQPFRP
ncbi:MAG TPA: serine protease [Actinomycetota bacterium]|nr:serine protease [Actinomycetota bacterium]